MTPALGTLVRLALQLHAHSAVIDRTPVSVYVVPCPCGEEIRSNDPNVKCPKCGTLIFVDWRNQDGMDNKK